MSDSKSPGSSAPAAKKPRAAPPAGPSMYSMLVDAITSLNDRKGASLPAIKSYILDKHPEADNAMLRSRLKKALAKGMEKGVICRPKAAESAGTSMTGRFRLDKTALAKETKPKKTAEKPKKKPEKKPAEKKKKTSTSKSPKTTKKTTKSAKSPKSPKAKTTKSKAAKSPKAKKTAEKKKTKSPSAKKSVAKTKKATDKTKKPKAKTTKKTPTKKAKAK